MLIPKDEAVDDPEPILEDQLKQNDADKYYNCELIFGFGGFVAW